MLHGHAKIELTNVKTGEKQVIEHDNYMTNWLRDALTPLSIAGRNLAGTNPSRESSTTFKKENLFGGVILFENALDNDADNYKFPRGNKMIAHGWNETYGGTDMTAGSFNTGLSVIGTDSATFVWDWLQERGNGTISALGLTNIWGGKIGSGHSGSADINLPMSLAKRQFWESTSGHHWSLLYFDEDNSYAYFSNPNVNGNQILSIRKCKLWTHYFDSLTDTLSDGTGLYTNGEDVNVDLSAYFSANANFSAVVYDDVLYMFSTSDWANGTSKTVVKYNYATNEITTQSITNNVGETIYCEGTIGGFGIVDGVLYGQTRNSHFFYINLSDNTDCGIVKDETGANITLTGSVTGSRVVMAWGELFFGVAGTVDSARGQTFVLDGKSVAKRRNLSGYEAISDGQRMCFGGNKLRSYYMGWYGYYTQSYPNEVYNLMCLQTKNNLQTPVTKTSDMTMRVTYTIQEASE